jgi:hypothetical protein
MSNPSLQILDLLLDMMKKKNLNTASLSQKSGIDNQLMLLSAALELQETDFLQMPTLSAEPDQSKDSAMLKSTDSSTDWTPNPMGIQAEQLIRLGFALGVDILFTAETKYLKESHVPESILKKFDPKMPIRLDAAYHHHYRPNYFDDGLEVRLSFDALYTCFFPWHSIDQVTCFVFEEEPESEKVVPLEEKTNPTPFLRVVK